MAENLIEFTDDNFDAAVLNQIYQFWLIFGQNGVGHAK